MQEFFEKSKIKKPQNSDSTANFENHVVTECNRLLTTIDVLEADLDCLMAEIMKLEAGACPSELLEPYNNCFGSTSPQSLSGSVAVNMSDYQRAWRDGDLG
ncbi:hypothetical protein J6590_006614 [Homalodisca vitripennis]|nr:hypothetical protein J6590_006614 [Homalodisca vitripennis]